MLGSKFSNFQWNQLPSICPKVTDKTIILTWSRSGCQYQCKTSYACTADFLKANQEHGIAKTVGNKSPSSDTDHTGQRWVKRQYWKDWLHSKKAWQTPHKASDIVLCTKHTAETSYTGIWK